MMSGITSHRMKVDLFTVSIKLLSNGPILTGIDVVGNTWSNEAVLGRDVLNQLEITLNGPGESTIIRND